MSDPSTELRQYMAQWDLHPPEIVFDGKIHRFKAEGERGGHRGGSGWYRAFVDQRGAVFGCHKTGVDEVWQLRNGQRKEDFDPAAWARMQEEWAEKKRAIELETKRQQAEVAERCRARWEAAAPASTDHPYLKRKGVTNARGLKQEGDILLAPMKDLTKKAEIVSLQTIPPDGKDKLFVEGGRAKGTRTTIGGGRFKGDGVLYLCEGWVTGWSVHKVTGATVVVAYFKDNLLEVATYLKQEYPSADLVIAADNDRWTHIKNARFEVHNPGVTKARLAAAAVGGRVAIPEFVNACRNPACEKDGCEQPHPTDFNDLHQAEGEDAVRRWLDPARAADAVTYEAPASGDGPPPAGPSRAGKSARHLKLETGDGAAPTPSAEQPSEPPAGPPPERPSWLDTARFRCLGYDRGTYFYLPTGTGQITGLTAGQHDKKYLMTLAPLPWWETYFPAPNGISWATAADALLRANERAGVFRPERVRGRGCWPEKAGDGTPGILVHLGERLLPPGRKRYIKPEEYQSPTRFMYERQQHLEGPSTDPLSLAEAGEILEIFRSLLWRDPASGYLAAGWTVLAPICGALQWRPHIFLTGERGCGKSTVLSRLIVPLLADMVVDVVGETTEAGIRQELRADALAVVFDEAEEHEAAGRRIQAVLALARQASSESGARTLKGTVHGGALQFRVRSMFCLASIGGAVYQESDKSRVTLLSLRGASQVSQEERQDHWRRMAPRLATIGEETGPRMIARTLGLLRSGMVAETVKVFRQAAAAVLGEQRTGDQYGTLYAGAWTLMADEPPQADEAREIVASEDLSTYQEDAVPEGKKALQMILQQVERVERAGGAPVTLAVGQLVEICCGKHGPVTVEEADARLRQIGIRVEVKDGAYELLVANSSDWMRRTLRDTLYSRGVRTVLQGLPGVVSGPQTRFHQGLSARVSRVPLVVLD